MNGRTTVTVVDLDRERLTALCAVVQPGKVAVRNWVAVSRPESIAGDNAEAVGQWVGQELRKAEIPRGRVVLAMPRGDVVLKRLTVPAGAAASAVDLGGIVHLQMSRQLTMAMEGTAVDYAPIQEPVPGAGAPPPAVPAPGGSGATPAPDAAPTLTVMAGAMPADRVAWCRAMAEAGDLALKRIGLRCFGAAALLAELSQRRAGPVLGVAIGWGSVEFVVVEDGQMVFARAVDAPRPQAQAEVEPFAERVAVEAKRTWMSHRAARATGELELVAVLGAGDLARLVGQRCGQQMEARWELVRPPAVVEMPDRLPESEVSMLAPMVGLLVESVVGLSTLDFANPRRTPNAAEVKRRRVLLGVLGAILVGGGAYVGAQRQLGSLEEDVEASRQQVAELETKYEAFLVEHARLSHIEQWSQARVDWLAYLDVLNQQLPDPKLAILDTLGGQLLNADVQFSPKGKYPEGSWAVGQTAQFSMDGKMAQRAVAADLRGKLLELFENVSSKGPDVPDRFSLELQTSRQTPKRAVPADAKGAAAGADARAPAKTPSGPAPGKEAKK